MPPLPNILSDIVDRLVDEPERTAIIERRDEKSARWNRRQFSDCIHQLAAGLRQRGLSSGDRVALMSPTSAESAVVVFATIVAGGVIVPLDTQFEHEVLENVLRDCRPSFLFTTSETRPRLEECHNSSEIDVFLLGEEPGQYQSWQTLISEDRFSSEEFDAIVADDYAVLFYTSGTTGPPKGVPLTHRNLALQIRVLANAEITSPDDRVLLPLPIHHVYPFVVGLLTTLALRLPIVIPQSLTGPEISAALREEKINIVVGVPRLYEALYESIENRIEGLGQVAVSFFQTLLDATEWLERKTRWNVGKAIFRPLRKRVAPELRWLTSGGSPLDPELYRKLNSLGWEIGVGYGLTETSPLLTLNLSRDGNPESVGKPIEETEIRIDTESVQTDDGSKEDSAGEILARGSGVFKEYWNRTETTEEAFTEDGWFRTGDLGYFDEKDFLYVTGRVSTMIVTSSGENIQPDDVEEALTIADEIAEAGVLQADDQLVAVIVPEELEFDSRNGETVDLEQRISDAVHRQSEKLPSYQRIQKYELSSRALPRTRLGKIRRHKLEARYRELVAGKHDGSSREPISIDEMAASDQKLLDDERVNSVWKYLCERYSDKHLSPDSSLQLDLGVDSMEWINLSIEVQERTGIPLTDEKIRDLESIRDLLQTVSESLGEDQKPEELLADPEAILSDDQRRWVEPLGPVRRLVPRYGYALNRALQKTFFQLKVTGRENLPHEPPFVIAANHISSLDPFVIAAALDQKTLQRIYWAAWTGRVFQNSLARQFSRCTRSIPIDPAQGPVASLAVASAVLKRGNNLVWFPEGQRSPNGKLQSLRPGLGRLLEHDHVQVVPTSIQGTYAALPPDRYTPRFRPVTVTFGKPHRPEELEELGQGDQPHERIIDGLEQELRAIVEEASNVTSH